MLLQSLWLSVHASLLPVAQRTGADALLTLIGLPAIALAALAVYHADISHWLVGSALVASLLLALTIGAAGVARSRFL